MTNRTLKVVVGLAALHLILLLLLHLIQGVSAYAAGQLTGKFVLFFIVAVALLRVLKYGWGVSLFLLAGTLVSETRLFLATLAQPVAGEPAEAIWIVFLAVNLPLVAAIILLLKPSSREPFKARFGKPDPGAAV